jgi:hypothetical protein
MSISIYHRNLLQSNKDFDGKRLADRREASIMRTNLAKAELVEFVQKTLRSVIQQEQRQFQATPSLVQFCRVDLGIMESKQGRLDYFVNEIERGINVSLWTGKMTPERAGEVVNRFGKSLHSWITQAKDISNSF